MAGPTSIATIENSILWGDAGGLGTTPGAGEVAGATTVGWSDVAGGFPGLGNMNANPMFVAGPLTLAPGDPSWDIHLRLDSPCRDSVFPPVGGYPERDFDGDARVANQAADMGADEVLGGNGTSPAATALTCFINGNDSPTVLQRIVNAGDTIAVSFTSPIFVGYPALLALQIYVDGHPPAGIAGVFHLDPAVTIPFYGALAPNFGGALMTPWGVNFSFAAPAGIAGLDVRVQGVSWVPDPQAPFWPTAALDLLFR